MKALLLLASAGFAVMLVTACSSPTSVCAGLGRVSPTIPDTVTLKVGAATLALAGEDYDVCVGEPEHPPAHNYLWISSDSTVAFVAPIDSIHARISGRHAGSAHITVAYANGGRQVGSIRGGPVIVRFACSLTIVATDGREI